jgi:hypothetical protein
MASNPPLTPYQPDMEKTPSKTGDGSKGQKGDQPAFEPRKGKVIEHTKIGVWDLYQERDRFLSYFPTSLKIDAYTEMWNDLPYLWRAIRDLFSVAWPMMTLYLFLTIVKSVLPALTLWCVRPFLSTTTTTTTELTFFLSRYSGQLLAIVSIDINRAFLKEMSFSLFPSSCRLNPLSTRILSMLAFFFG